MMEVEWKYVQVYFKITTMFPPAKNNLYFSNIQNTLTISWSPIKVLIYYGNKFRLTI